MAHETILLADNDGDFLQAHGELLRREGFRVLVAADPPAARRLLEQGGIDLAVLDVRLQADDDEQDISGLQLAADLARTVPKIMLTGYPAVEFVRRALKVLPDGLPAAVDFLAKAEGFAALRQAIHRALGPELAWLRRVRTLIDSTDEQLKQDYQDAQGQARANYLASLVVAILGVILLFISMALVLTRTAEIGWVTAIGGVLTEAVGILFFRRVDAANERMDRYHRERLEGQRFDTLLNACRGLRSPEDQQSGQLQVILTARDRWLGQADRGSGPGTGQP